MIKNKKRNFISNKLTENIAKLKELWKTLVGLTIQTESNLENKSKRKRGS